MKPSCKKVWDQYEEGRITRTGFVIDFLNAADQEDLREALEVLPPELLEELRGFVASYRPDMLIIRGRPPKPAAVKTAKEVLADAARPT
jgi:hypothetical protein